MQRLGQTLILLGLVLVGLIVRLRTMPADPRLAGATENTAARTTSEPATEPEPAVPVPPPSLTLIAVGDIMLSRVVGQKMRERGFDYPFAAVTDWLNKGDLVFANLESPVLAGSPVSTGTMVFRSDPEAAPALARAGIDIVSLANNHTMNKGSEGMRATLDYLQAAGIAAVGAGEDAAAAAAPTVIEKNGLKIGFLAYTDTDVVPESYGATADKPGVNFMDIEEVRRAVAALDPLADFTIVSMHSGTEYTVEPNERQTTFARAAVAAGADLIIGHHPHVVQRAEIYQDIPIFYSLGNFVFDQMWSEETRRGLAVTARLTKGEPVEITELTPVVIFDYSRPEVTADEATKTAILERLGDFYTTWKSN